MLFIEAVVRKLVPELVPCGNLSVACITTTNPVYLVFSRQHSYPELVLRIADSAEKVHAHQVLERLYDVVEDLVPKPLTLGKFDGHQFAIQEGVIGLPWFRIAEKYVSTLEWEDLGEQSRQSLLHLQEGIRCIPDWLTSCNPGQELRKCFQECVQNETFFSPQVRPLVEQFSQQLDDVGVIASHYQHGDFCLNNLILAADNKITVIDFDDFGITDMPFHDEFTLALSMYSLAPRTISSTLKSELQKGVKDAVAYYGLNQSLLPAFFLHHLLFRLGKWSDSNRRQQYRTWLLSLTEEFLKSPFPFFFG